MKRVGKGLLGGGNVPLDASNENGHVGCANGNKKASKVAATPDAQTLGALGLGLYASSGRRARGG